jgi:hypothetical protein
MSIFSYVLVDCRSKTKFKRCKNIIYYCKDTSLVWYKYIYIYIYVRGNKLLSFTIVKKSQDCLYFKKH